MDELGLDEALIDGCALIEWPDRAADRLPPDALHIELRSTGPSSREARLHGPARWADMIFGDEFSCRLSATTPSTIFCGKPAGRTPR